MFDAVVIGVSAGGLEALSAILPALPADFRLPAIVVQHTRDGSDNYLAVHLNRLSAVTVKEAEGGEAICPGTVYIAPAGYHLLIENDKTFSLSTEPPVSFARPSIDVLFESAAYVFGDGLIGVVLTGANGDGAMGLARVKTSGGMAVVQDPNTARVSAMPIAAIAAADVDHILALPDIAALLCEVGATRRPSIKYRNVE